MISDQDRFGWDSESFGALRWETDEERQAAKEEKRAAALTTWERKALNRLKEGRAALCNFESADLDPKTVTLVRGALHTAATPEDVRDLFADLRAETPTEE